MTSWCSLEGGSRHPIIFLQSFFTSTVLFNVVDGFYTGNLKNEPRRCVYTVILDSGASVLLRWPLRGELSIMWSRLPIELPQRITVHQAKDSRAFQKQ